MTIQNRSEGSREPKAAPAERQIQADVEVNRQHAERVKDAPAADIDEPTVEKIAEDAEQRAKH